jgi:hypothetical protein
MDGNKIAVTPSAYSYPLLIKTASARAAGPDRAPGDCLSGCSAPHLPRIARSHRQAGERS